MRARHLRTPLAAVLLAVALALPLWAASALAALAWPGEAWTAATDLTSLNPTGWASNLSGAYWNPVSRRLWVCTNSPAKFWALHENGLGGFVIEREYTGTGDLEGITQLGTATDRVFLIDEQARTLRSYRISDGTALTTWLLSTIPDWENSGPEGIAFVPDAWLAASGFVDGNGVPYPQSVHGAGGFGGVLFVAVQTSGWVYAFDLRTDGTYTFVGRYLTSRAESCELAFDASTGTFFVLHNIGGNFLETTDLTSTLNGSDRRFVTRAEFQVPSTSNIEGLAVTPALTATKAVGDGWCFFTDDDATNGALRWFKQLRATLAKAAGDGQSAAAGTAVAVPPAVLARDAFTDALPGFTVNFAVASGGGSVTGGAAVTDSDGVARVGSWVLGGAPGENTLTATGTGLVGSPATFVATGTDPGTGVGDDGPGGLRLGPPAPNPGRGELRIPFVLPAAGEVELAVFDLNGRRIATVARGTFAAGTHRSLWDGRGDDGTPARAGVYLYRLRAGGAELARRGLLVR